MQRRHVLKPRTYDLNSRLGTWRLSQLTALPLARRYGLTNVPLLDEYEKMVNLERLVELVLEPLRAEFGSRLHLVSAYHAEAVHRLLGIEATSHLDGRAVDITVSGVPQTAVLQAIMVRDIDFDTVVLNEHFSLLSKRPWVHVSVPEAHAHGRRRLLVHDTFRYRPFKPEDSGL